MIKYLGSKRLLIPHLMATFRAIKPNSHLLDLFSGTSRVGHAAKRQGFCVWANDHNAYAATIATCYIQASKAQVEEDAKKLIAEYNALPGSPGWFTRTYCEQSRFFRPENGERIDAIRERIEAQGLNKELKAVVLTSLMEAADRVDSTVGIQMAYLKSWAPRALNPLELKIPELLPRASAGPGRAFRLEAVDAARMDGPEICYMDPPYNQHKYLGNYHIWESLVLWDKPEVYGVAQKRVDCKTRSSDFNSRSESLGALQDVIEATSAPNIVVSFSNEGFIQEKDIIAALRRSDETAVLIFGAQYKRYVGSKIGVYNLNGDKVGSPGKSTNTEWTFVSTSDTGAVERLQKLGAREV